MTGPSPPLDGGGAGDRAPPAAIAETHISVVTFIGDRAYKLKKPVRFGFLDFSTREAREAVCHREVELNRRLAPDVYLGVADVVGPDGELADHLVVMRRLPPERRLATLVTSGAPVDDDLRALAHLLAAFHAGAERGAAIDAAASPDAVRELWEGNLRELRPFAGSAVGSVLDGGELRRIEHLAEEFLAGRAPLLEQRIAGGHIVDGHGDLQCADVFCLPDGPRVLDCIEFNDAFRFGDTALDLAFLAMDLERLGRADLAQRVVAQYEELAGERIPRSLLHHYIAYRALVRAKVATLRSAQEDPDAADAVEQRAQAAELLALCRRHLEAARVRLVVVGGLPGTGKTTVARGLAERLGADLLRSDEIRKELAGLSATERSGDGFGQGIYAAGSTEATYDELLRRAALLLGRGESVVLDASWNREIHRARARELAVAVHAEPTELRCDVDATIAAERIGRRLERGHDASDATPAVAAAMAAEADPWPSAHVVSTFRPPLDVLDRIAAHLGVSPV